MNATVYRRHPTYTNWILGSLVIIWGLILPFICWGTWATPGHAHAGPHTAFTVPKHHAHAPGAELVGGPASTSDAEPVGVSRPAGLLATILLLVLLSPWHLPQPRNTTQASTRPDLGTKITYQLVPTPPPRLPAAA